MKASDITGIATCVTKKWAKQRKAEERSARAKERREYMYSDRICATDVAREIIDNAYAKVSDNGRLPAAQRQLYYAAREEFHEHTGKQLDYKYFAQNLLRQHLNRPHTRNWKVSRDARGTFIEPHTHEEVPIGTLQVDDYLARSEKPPADEPDLEFETDFPTCGPRNRYQAVLYIEKEGFNQLFKAVKLAERHDIAIMSCKGQSVIAARKLVDRFCHVRGVPLLVLHDFDKYGFEIYQSLSGVSWAAEDAGRVAYQFRNEIDVVDLGLRLKDVERWNLDSERCRFTGSFDGGCEITEEEQEYLRSGRRVELNAFTSSDFVEFVEERLQQAGIKEKLIPDDQALETAYRRAYRIAYLNKVIEDANDDAEREADEAQIPKTLRSKLRKALRENREQPWDVVLYDIVNETVTLGPNPLVPANPGPAGRPRGLASQLENLGQKLSQPVSGCVYAIEKVTNASSLQATTQEVRRSHDHPIALDFSSLRPVHQ